MLKGLQVRFMPVYPWTQPGSTGGPAESCWLIWLGQGHSQLHLQSHTAEGRREELQTLIQSITSFPMIRGSLSQNSFKNLNFNECLVVLGC